MTGIHVYRQRHIFKGDVWIGRYEVRKRTFVLEEERTGCEQEVKAYFVRNFGIVTRRVVEEETGVPGGGSPALLSVPVVRKKVGKKKVVAVKKRVVGKVLARR